MAQSAPHYSLRKIIDRLQALDTGLFVGVTFLSVAPVLLTQYAPDLQWDNWLNTLNIIVIILFFALDTTCDYFLTPMAEAQRRDDFLDNSFGSKFIPVPSLGYFDNDQISTGLYKAATNLFENCFFTYSLVRAITLKRLLLPLAVLLAVAACAWSGFKQISVALPLLQALLSTKLLLRVIKHLALMVRLDHIQDSIINLFSQNDFKTNPENFRATFYRLWLKYETLHSTIPADIPDKVFQKMNPRLSMDWENIKTRYNIK